MQHLTAIPPSVWMLAQQRPHPRRRRAPRASLRRWPMWTAAAAAVLLLGSHPAMVGAQPAGGQTPLGPLASEGLRCNDRPLPAGAQGTAPDHWQVLPVGTSLPAPSSLALDRGCNLYVTDTQLNQVLKLSPGGDVLARWGGQGSAPGKFSEPNGVAVDAAGNVYVGDDNNGRVQELSPQGEVIRIWSGTCERTPRCTPVGIDLLYPGRDIAVAVDGAGSLFVASNNRLFQISPQGRVVAQWGSEGTAPGQFRDRRRIALDGTGNLYVVDSDNQRIQEFGPDGAFRQQWGGAEGSQPGQFEYPRGVAVDRNGTVLATDWGNYRLQAFDAASGTAYQLSVCHVNGGSGPQCLGGGVGEFALPAGVAVDGLGNVYVIDAGTSPRIEVLLTRAVQASAPPTPMPTGPTPVIPSPQPGPDPGTPPPVDDTPPDPVPDPDGGDAVTS